MTVNSPLIKTILSVPDTSDKVKWYQCYLKDHFVVNGVRITCDPILDKSYVLKENSTLHTVPTYVPELFTPFYLRCPRVVDALHPQSRLIFSL